MFKSDFSAHDSLVKIHVFWIAPLGHTFADNLNFKKVFKN